MRNSTWLSMAWNNSVYGILCTYITQRLLRIYTNTLKQLCKQCIALLIPLGVNTQIDRQTHIPMREPKQFQETRRMGLPAAERAWFKNLICMCCYAFPSAESPFMLLLCDVIAYL